VRRKKFTNHRLRGNARETQIYSSIPPIWPWQKALTRIPLCGTIGFADVLRRLRLLVA